jgi:molybdopterin-guanine dinucleotide biosynthesis protein A
MTKRAALILAGGKARRFQNKHEKWQDKALAELFGKPLLIHAIENVRDVVENIVACVNDETRKARYSSVLMEHCVKNVRLVTDEKISHVSGPNVAILTGLKSIEAEYCFTLPCDMPFIKPRVVDYLFNAAKDAQVAVPMWPNGRLETLIMVLERSSILEITDTLCQLRRPRSDDIIRGVPSVMFVSPLSEIKTLDPDLRSFININHREDLTQLQTRPVHGSITENLHLNLGSMHITELKRLRDASTLGRQGKLLESSRIFSSCAIHLEKENSFFWAGISRENEGESLLSLCQRQTDPQLADELDSKGKEALLKAANNYGLEAGMHEKGRCRFLAERAKADKSWCESWAMGKLRQTKRYPPKS